MRKDPGDVVMVKLAKACWPLPSDLELGPGVKYYFDALLGVAEVVGMDELHLPETVIRVRLELRADEDGKMGAGKAYYKALLFPLASVAAWERAEEAEPSAECTEGG